MTLPSRRTLLRGAAGALALTAGCLDDGGFASSDDDDAAGTETETSGADDEPGGADDEPGGADDEPDPTVELESTDTVSFEHAAVPSEPSAALLESADRADGWLGDRDLDGAVAEFVAETAFEESVLVALEAAGSNRCYEMRIEDVALEDGDGGTDDHDSRLVLEASVSDDSGDAICAQQVIAVGRLVRATVSAGPVTAASASITDREGQTRAIDVTVDGESEPTAETDAETDSEPADG